MSSTHYLFNISGVPTLDSVRKEYKNQARKLHPDKKGGDQKSFVELKRAYDHFKSYGSFPKANANEDAGKDDYVNEEGEEDFDEDWDPQDEEEEDEDDEDEDYHGAEDEAEEVEDYDSEDELREYLKKSKESKKRKANSKDSHSDSKNKKSKNGKDTGSKKTKTEKSKDPKERTAKKRRKSSKCDKDESGNFFYDAAVNGNFDPTKPTKGKSAQRSEDVTQTYLVTLNELYKGKSCCEMQLSDGKILKFKIPAGTKDGSIFTFAGRSPSNRSDRIPGDLILIMKQIEHPTFTRDGNDLYVMMNISLYSALTGPKLCVTTLDGREIDVCQGEVITNETKKRIPKEGMVYDDGKKRGDLYVEFKIEYPQNVCSDATDKAELRRILQKNHEKQ